MKTGTVLLGCKSIGSTSKINELELKRLRLINKAFKAFPNSPKQMEIRAEIDDLTKRIEKLK